MKKVYRFLRNADMTEGRGPLLPVAHFSYKPDAFTAAQGQGVMGVGDGEVDEIFVYDSVPEWEEHTGVLTVETILNRLSPGERAALETHFSKKKKK